MVLCYDMVMETTTDKVEGQWVKNPKPLPSWTLHIEPPPITLGPINKTVKYVIIDALVKRNESWEDVELCTLNNVELEQEYDEYVDHVEFTLWTKNRVYFSVYCCWCSIVSASRNPNIK